MVDDLGRQIGGTVSELIHPGVEAPKRFHQLVEFMVLRQRVATDRQTTVVHEHRHVQKAFFGRGVCRQFHREIEESLATILGPGPARRHGSTEAALEVVTLPERFKQVHRSVPISSTVPRPANPLIGPVGQDTSWTGWRRRLDSVVPVATGTLASVTPTDLNADDGAIDVVGVTKAFGSNTVLRDVALEVAPGSTLALLGPSGCGKTTLLRIIAGLERCDEGTVRIGREVVSGQRTFVPPERRRVGMVFQDWALFPHLSVGNNVGYGLASGGKQAPERIRESLALVGLQDLTDRMPGTLSGGQQQRVALARAIAPRPRALLFDEPFSNLDSRLRIQIRSEVNQLLTDLGITSVFVTHDQEEAFVLGKEVAVMYGGVIRQQGSPSEIYQRPADPWVADFVGDANFLRGTASGRRAETALGSLPLQPDGPTLSGSVEVLIRPEQLTVERCHKTSGQPIAGVVEYYGHDHMIRVQLASGEELHVRGAGPPNVGPGDTVVVGVRGGALVAYAAEA